VGGEVGGGVVVVMVVPVSVAMVVVVVLTVGASTVVDGTAHRARRSFRGHSTKSRPFGVFRSAVNCEDAGRHTAQSPITRNEQVIGSNPISGSRLYVLGTALLRLIRNS
jgi:hypothetical protein